MNPRRGSGLGLASLLVAAGAAFVLAVCLGATVVPPATLLVWLRHGGAALQDADRSILEGIRLPRAVMGASVGALLALAGVLLQGFLRNPLAEPYLLGTSSGAALAVSAAIVLGLPEFVHGIYLLPWAAFAGALATIAAVYALARTRGRLEVTTLVLAGVVASAFLSALILLLAYLAGARYFEILGWMMGHLQPLTAAAPAWTAGLAVAGLGLAWMRARDLNALLLGEEIAASLGVDVEREKRGLFVLSSLLTGAAVASSGLIGFVGLVAPHTARLIVGPDHRKLVPASALAGATLLLLSDVCARTLAAPAELPVGVVTAVLGGPFFLFLLLRHVRKATGAGR